MAESTQVNFIDQLQQALIFRKEWLEKHELVRLKEILRSYQSSFATLYSIYLKKKLINEDPYKEESKISEIEIPETGSFNEMKRIEQLSIRLSQFDSQLDFLVNFYQLGIDYLNLDRIKRIVGLIRYIDWVNLTPDSRSINTRAVGEMTNQSKAGLDSLTVSIIGECLGRLSKSTIGIMGILKDLTTYYKEAYKLNIRQTITNNMTPYDATPANIKKRMPSAMPGEPFFVELIDELIKEDYSDEGPELREAVLKAVNVTDSKPKSAKAPVNFKGILLNGIQVIGGASTSLAEIGTKFDENHEVMQSRRKSFWEMIIHVIKSALSNEQQEVIYDISYFEPSKGINVKESINFHRFREEMAKKTRILNSFVRGQAYQKLSAMTDEQIISYLERNIRDVQYFHKILSAMDDFFKANVPIEFREKIKGVKPELSALKNSYVKANQLRHEYGSQKEEEEQMKRLGINQID
jgi:hypothetical protein